MKLLHKRYSTVKQQNKIGVVDKLIFIRLMFYQYTTPTCQNYKCSFKFAKIIVKTSTGLFLWTQCSH